MNKITFLLLIFTSILKTSAQDVIAENLDAIYLGAIGSGLNVGQSFQSETDTDISKILFLIPHKHTGTLTLNLYDDNSNIIATKTEIYSSAIDIQTITFDSPISIVKNTSYTFYISSTAGLFYRYSDETYSNGQLEGSNSNPNHDLWFQVISSPQITLSTKDLKQSSNISIRQTGNTIYFETSNTNTQIKSVSVFDTLGRIIQTVNNKNQLNIEQLNNGIYILKIETSEGIFTKRIIKK